MRVDTAASELRRILNGGPLLSDFRFALRRWIKHPGFSAVALLTLTLGIGTNIAMFTVLRSVLWRPLPYPSPERLVVLEADVEGVRNAGASNRELDEMRMRSRTLAELAVAVGVDAHVEIAGEMERVAAASVTSNLLRTLGVRPALGRLFDERDEAVEGPTRVVVISHGLWRQRLGSDPAAIGLAHSRQQCTSRGHRDSAHGFPDLFASLNRRPGDGTRGSRPVSTVEVMAAEPV